MEASPREEEKGNVVLEPLVVSNSNAQLLVEGGEKKSNDNVTAQKGEEGAGEKGGSGSSDAFCGIQLDGKYLPVQKKKISGRATASYWVGDGNIQQSVGRFSHVYYNTKLSTSEEESGDIFLSPGVILKLRDGHEVTYMAVVTRNGQGTNILVGSESLEALELVSLGDVVSAQKPKGKTDLGKVRDLVKSFGEELDSHNQRNSKGNERKKGWF
jgi:hypothetical protein